MSVQPDYMTTYLEDWADIVEPDGVLNRDQIARELSDYSVVMREASKVYEELADLSKPNTAAHHVIEAAERKYARSHAWDACDSAEVYDAAGNGVAADALREFAEDLEAGIWQEFVEVRERRAEIAAKRAAKDGAL